MNAPALFDNFLISTVNALVDGSHLSQLKGLELAVLLVYIRRANANGDAFPGPTSIAKLIGHKNVNHVCTARRRLVKKGFLTSKGTDDQGRTWFHVNLQNTSQKRTSPEMGLVPNRDYDQSRNGTSTSPESGQEVVPNRDLEVSNRSTTLKHSLNHTHSAGADDGGSGDKKPSAPRKAKGKQTTDHVAADVARIWEAYPLKEGKPSGMRAIAKALKEIRSRPDAPTDAVAWLLERVRDYAASVEGKERRFIKHPSGWFNDARYDSEIAQPDDWMGPAVRPPLELLASLGHNINPAGEFKETTDADRLVIKTA